MPGFEADDLQEAFAGVGTSGGGPTAPAEGGPGGGGFFQGILDIAKAVVPGVQTGLNLFNRVSTAIRGFSGAITGGGTPEISLLDNQISTRSAFAGSRDWYGATSPNVETPYIPGGPGSYYSTGPEFTGEQAAMYSIPGGVSSMDLAIPTAEGIPRTLRQWLYRIAVAYGPAVATAVWEEFQKRRRAGQSSTMAKATLDEAYPVRGRIMRRGRRRMNPANVRALRRALRRVRAFKRVTRKVRGLHLWGQRGGKSKIVYRRARRGDLWLVEDQADMYDEAEDLGYDPEFFRGDEEEEMS